MNRIRSTWERWLTAVTLAEAGEHAAARAELRPQRLVLLALRRGAAEPELLRFTANLSRRVNAGVVTVWECAADEQPPAPLSGFAEQCAREALYHEVLRCEGPLPEAVIAYADAHPCIAFVIVDPASGWQPAKGERGGPWSRLACPLVVAGAT